MYSDTVSCGAAPVMPATRHPMTRGVHLLGQAAALCAAAATAAGAARGALKTSAWTGHQRTQVLGEKSEELSTKHFKAKFHCC
jgi:hypothetical protein